MNTLLLDTQLWDILLDVNGNLAIASEPYRLAQDVASAVKLFRGELYYNTKPGVPYFQNILGQAPPLEYVRAQIVKAALTVRGVVKARCTIDGYQNRKLVGSVECTDNTGRVFTVGI